MDIDLSCSRYCRKCNRQIYNPICPTCGFNNKWGVKDISEYFENE